MDKTTLTKFKLDSLFEVIDAIYENNGQLVLNTNMTMGEFEALKRRDLTRRITTDAHQIFNFLLKPPCGL
jgi:hypothetical protein